MRSIQPGDRVWIHYQSRSLEGPVLETSGNREAFEFVAGSEEVIPAVSQGVIGMRLSEKATITADPDRAFGRPSASLRCSAPTWAIPTGSVAGDQMQGRLPNAVVDVWLERCTNSGAVLDANHPLAGETLLIDLEIVSVRHAALSPAVAMG